MTFDQVKEHLAAGKILIDIGQIDKAIIGWLNVQVKNRRLVQGLSYEFPIPKRAWRLPDKWDR